MQYDIPVANESAHSKLKLVNYVYTVAHVVEVVEGSEVIVTLILYWPSPSYPIDDDGP